MKEPRLKADLWVRACLQLCAVDGIPAYLRRKGDADAGAVLIKLNRLEMGAEVLVQSRDANGKRVWMRGTGPDPVSEADSEAYIARQIAYDSDLWVIEIEDRAGRVPFADPVIA